MKLAGKTLFNKRYRNLGSLLTPCLRLPVFEQPGPGVLLCYLVRAEFQGSVTKILYSATKTQMTVYFVFLLFVTRSRGILYYSLQQKLQVFLSEAVFLLTRPATRQDRASYQVFTQVSQSSSATYVFLAARLLSRVSCKASCPTSLFKAECRLLPSELGYLKLNAVSVYLA